MSGSVHRKDRIISVNNQSLRGLSNKEAARLLRTAGDRVILELRRRRREDEREIGGIVEDGRRTGQLESAGTEERADDNEGGLRARSPLSPSVVQWANILGPDKELIVSWCGRG